MDAVTPKPKHDTLDTHSHVVRPAQMEWKKTRFPGCEVKGLLFDKETGARHRADEIRARRRRCPTTSMSGSSRPMCSKASWSTRKARRKDLTVGPGEFVWREAGSRHVAWTPEGGLMLAMFQVPEQVLRAGRPGHRHFRHRLGQPVGARL